MAASVEAQAPKAFSDATVADDFKLRGILISESRRLALVNGTVAREGDRVGNAKILAIGKNEVHILVGSREFVVRVGSTADPASQPAMRQSTSKRHAVRRGETLSGISQRYLTSGTTLNQMMIALFEANPKAFNGNINILYEGAVLKIPGVEELRRQSSESAMAEVIRQENEWRNADHQQTLVAMESNQRHYGPVTSGETLSGIAARLLRDGFTLNQVMVALYRANPNAFSGNMDVLYQGAILRIPDELETNRPDPAITAAYSRMTAPGLAATNPTLTCRLLYRTLQPDPRSQLPEIRGIPSLGCSHLPDSRLRSGYGRSPDSHPRLS